MLCRDHKCLFVHIPKTAGQSVETCFLNLCGLGWDERSKFLLGRNSRRDLGPERLAHLTAAEYTDCGYVTQQEFGSLFKFAFVRNPWERLVSVYKYRGHTLSGSFREFVLQCPDLDRFRNHDRHIMTQYEYLHDNTGRLLVDFIGRFENLQTDFDEICGRLGLRPLTLPRVNETKSKSSAKALLKGLFSSPRSSFSAKYQDYYDDETRRVVEQRYRHDIEVFGYRFDKQAD